MLFSSAICLFYFLPALLFCYYIPSGTGVKNKILLFFSLIFFSWGGLGFTLILASSIIFNFLVGIRLEKQRSKWLFAFGIAGNLGLLLWFKYANFFVLNLNLAFGALNLSPLSIGHVLLPIGISFYTFHSISYLADIHSGKSPAQKNLFDMALYIVLFTQLIAGPIIRYNTFASQLYGRVSTRMKFGEGTERFIIGLGKKVLIANTLARLADESFQQDIHSMSTLLSWMGALCYTFQIYFDFSGYSDMAIGLSRMFGFEFPENFNLPYRAGSIRDFWQRWHISLSSFFRDYLYFPLGGNQRGKLRTYANLILVFFLTGLWHGANYTFILWGMIHGAFLILERSVPGQWFGRVPLFFRRAYAFLVVLLAWIAFRADNVSYAMHYYRSLWPNGNDNRTELVYSYFTTDFLLAMAAAILLSFGWFKTRSRDAALPAYSAPWKQVMSACLLLAVMFLSIAYLISGTYNPFIYYQF